MNKNDNDRYRELVKILNKYSYEYHALDKPTVSDAVYDGLMSELKAIEGEYPNEIAQDSPSMRVGSEPIENSKNMPHTSRMISLLDSFSDEETMAWIERIKKLDSRLENADFWVDSKKDGLACSLHYQDGKLSGP
jgi:DNA ligase (NAD+)